MDTKQEIYTELSKLIKTHIDEFENYINKYNDPKYFGVLGSTFNSITFNHGSLKFTMSFFIDIKALAIIASTEHIIIDRDNYPNKKLIPGDLDIIIFHNFIKIWLKTKSGKLVDIKLSKFPDDIIIMQTLEDYIKVLESKFQLI